MTRDAASMPGATGMTTIEIDGNSFRVEVEGDPSRPAVLLVNSLGTDLRLWDVQMPGLLEHFRVVRYDARGHGGSAVPDGPLSIGRLGRDAVAILDALRIDKTHVVGISLGGAVVEWLIAHAPARVERAVICCAAARPGTPDVWNARILEVRREGMASLIDATLERWFSPAFRANAPDQVAVVREMLLATTPEGYAACCGALRDTDLRQALRLAEAPVLIVTGSDDPAITRADTALMLAALPNGRHVEMAARHIVNIEAAATFTPIVVEFLTAKLPARRAAARPAARTKASRHATAARQPIAKRARPRKARAGAAVARKVAGARKPTRSRPSVRVAAAANPKRIRPIAPVKPAASLKVAVKAKKAQAATRRATKTSAARGAVKKAATKAKPGKTAPKKVAAKAPAKGPSAKRPPAPRRKPAKTPRRPSGRRKT